MPTPARALCGLAMFLPIIWCHSLAAQQSGEECSAIFFSPPLQVIENTVNCLVPGVGDIVRGRAWKVTAIRFDTLEEYAEGQLQFEATGQCLAALDLSLFMCEPEWEIPIEASDASGHRLKVVTLNLKIEEVNNIPIPACLEDGEGEFFNFPLPRWPCSEGGGGGGEGGECEPELGCLPPTYEWDPIACECRPVSATPILVSARGNRLELTDAAGGVDFDINADGFPERVSWTAPHSDDAFLVLDRNDNGVIDDATELFGNFTPQPPSETPNGFLALAVFDDNQDGIISPDDTVFPRLSFWMDWNHDGISQRSELAAVADAGVAAFELRYRLSRRTDRYGNAFRYISLVRMEGPNRGLSRKLAVDVILLTQP